MKVTSRVRRFTTLVVLLLAAAPLGSEAPQLVCRPIVRGDTASGLALRLTGNAATRHTSSFEIRDPAQRTFVPKSRYERLSTDWEACVARDVGGAAPLAGASQRTTRSSSRYDTTLAWQVGSAVSLLLFAWSAAARHVTPRPIPPALQRIGEQFASAFARPLIDPLSAAGEPHPDVALDGLAVKKLLGTFWFRSVFPQLSGSWRERLLEALAESIVIPNHLMRLGRRAMRLADMSYEQLKEISARTLVRGAAGTDLQLLLAIGDLWGERAFSRVRFVEAAEQDDPSRLSALLGFRG